MKKEDIIELLGITVGIVVLTRIFYPCIQSLFSIKDGYSAATLTSSLIMAIVTAVYVRYTYRIFDATNKNTEQTAKAQKIAYLERRLENFYIPIESALKKFDITEIDKLGRHYDEIVQDPNMPNQSAVAFIINAWCNLREDYNKIIPYTYLASKETTEFLTKFTNIFESNELFKYEIKDLNCQGSPSIEVSSYKNSVTPHEKYVESGTLIFATSNTVCEHIKEGRWKKYKQDSEHLLQYYNDLILAIHKDIDSFKAELAELLNQ